MHIIGLTGGIGSGKSTVSEKLRHLGYVIVDADAITHSLQQPGEPVLQQMVDAFGPAILTHDGKLDRPGLARRVFTDPDELARLNAIVHPAVGERIAAALHSYEQVGATVILDVPLLVESGRNDLTAIIVVDIDPELAIKRLVASRGFEEPDARARVSRQADRSVRLAKADHIIDNSGTLEELDHQLEPLHKWIQAITT